MEPIDKRLKALEWFKDWSNYLLVTTVAAIGWVASDKNIFCAPSWKAASIWSFGVSIVFGIFTLALIPLITQQIEEDDATIYDVPAKFYIFGKWKPRHIYLTQVCRPQHISFIAGIVFYCLGTASPQWLGLIVFGVMLVYGFFAKPGPNSRKSKSQRSDIKTL